MKPASKPVRQADANPEEKKEQIMRAILQKKASLAEGILYNLCQGCSNPTELIMADASRLVDIANTMADEFMKVVYHQEMTIKED